MSFKEVIQIFFEWLGLVKYKTRTVHKHHTHTIKRPEFDCRLYKTEQIQKIFELKKAGKTDNQIGKILGRTEGAIRQMRYMHRKHDTL